MKEFFRVPGLDPAVQRSFDREQLTELSLPMATSLMEGGYVAVVAAKAFDVEPWVIAIISAAPMFGNLSSFLWSRIAAGRPKVPLVLGLQAMVLLFPSADAVRSGAACKHGCAWLRTFACRTCHKRY